MSLLLRLTVVGLILFSIFTVYVTTPKEGEFAEKADEGYYYLFANTLDQKGIFNLPLLIKSYISDNNSLKWAFPAPSRIGHLLMTTFWFRLFPNTFVSLARFSLFCFIMFLIASFIFCKKYFGRDFSCLYVLLLSCSPLTMTLGRRVLSDIDLNLFLSISVWLFFDFLHEKKAGKFIIFLLVYSFSIIVKESSVILLLLFIPSFLIYKYKYKQNMPYYYLAGTVFGPIFLIGLTYIVLLNGIGNVFSLLNVIINLHLGVPSNYAMMFCTGSWVRYIIDYLLLTPFTTLLCIGYFFYILLSRKYDWKTIYFMIYFLVIFILFSNFRYTKVVRFVANLDMVISLFALLAIYELFRQKNKNSQMLLVVASAAAIFFVNYNNFLLLFYQYNIYDPVSSWLLQAKRIIPGW